MEQQAQFRGISRPGGEEQRSALLDLLGRSIDYGHWKLAIRRFLMLLACNYDIPLEYRLQCENFIASCPERELQRIRSYVEGWAEMLTPPPPRTIGYMSKPHTSQGDKYHYLHSISRPTI